jgi:hypothetical protein
MSDVPPGIRRKKFVHSLLEPNVQIRQKVGKTRDYARSLSSGGIKGKRHSGEALMACFEIIARASRIRCPLDGSHRDRRHNIA